MGDVALVCVKLSWRKEFIASIPIQNLNQLLDPRFVRDLKTDLHGASGSMNSRLRF